SYVGSKGRKLLQTRNINAVPYGANFLDANQDPTIATRTPLPNVSRRPYRGYQDILVSEFPGLSNYDAFQMQISRRYTAGFRFSTSYTFAVTKNVGIASPPNNNPTVNPFLAFLQR